MGFNCKLKTTLTCKDTMLPLSVYRCDTLLRLDKLALRTCVIHACLPAGLERIFLGQGALQIHLFNWTVARTVGEQYNTCAYLLTTPILPDMTHSACCLLYVCIGARVIDTPNLPHAPRIRAPTITINILLNMHSVHGTPASCSTYYILSFLICTSVCPCLCCAIVCPYYL